MNSKKLFYILSGLFALSLLATAGIAYAFGGFLQTKAGELATAKAQVEQLTLQQTNLSKSKQDIKKYDELNTIAQAIVPQDKDQAQTVRELTAIAARNRITLTSVTFPASNLGGNGSGSPSSSADKYSQLEKVKNLSGVYNLQITIANNSNNAVSFSQLNNFLADLEDNRRTATVASVNIQPQAGNANRLVFSLVINTYIKPS